MPLNIIAALVMIVLDQVVKYWAPTSLQAQHTIPLIENVFHLTYVENRGAAFSLLAQFDSRWIFVALSVIITIVIFIVLRIDYIQTALGRWSLVLVAAGALGNAIDRVIHGFVVDLFDFRLTDGEMEQLQAMDLGRSQFIDHYAPNVAEMFVDAGSV